MKDKIEITKELIKNNDSIESIISFNITSDALNTKLKVSIECNTNEGVLWSEVTKLYEIIFEHFNVISAIDLKREIRKLYISFEIPISKLVLVTNKSNSNIIGYFIYLTFKYMITKIEDGMLTGFDITPLGKIHTVTIHKDQVEKLVLLED